MTNKTLPLISRKSKRAFTLIELLVVISIIAILASLAIPAISGALVKGQMTQTLNNARQLHLATQTYSLDAVVSGGASWTLDEDGNQFSVDGFSQHLITNKYLSTNDLRKIYQAPGVVISYDDTTFSANNIAWSIMETRAIDRAAHVFLVTKNWQNGAVAAGSVPYGAKGFIVMQKQGSGSINKTNTATNSSVVGTGYSELQPLN